MGGDDLWGFPASVQCHQGEHWEVLIPDGSGDRDREGCVGNGDDIGELVILVGQGGWVIAHWDGFETLATITPRAGESYEFLGSFPEP
jgi:hypothetical protein